MRRRFGDCGFPADEIGDALGAVAFGMRFIGLQVEALARAKNLFTPTEPEMDLSSKDERLCLERVRMHIQKTVRFPDDSHDCIETFPAEKLDKFIALHLVSCLPDAEKIPMPWNLERSVFPAFRNLSVRRCLPWDSAGNLSCARPRRGPLRM